MPDSDKIQSQNEFSDLFYAYSLGCLDKKDLSELSEYFQTGNEFPWQELGEYQNLTALLPAILNMEIPGPDLKDKVARKLYRIKNERRPLKTGENILNEQELSGDYLKKPSGSSATLTDLFEDSKQLPQDVNQVNEENLKDDQNQSNQKENPSANLNIVDEELANSKLSQDISKEENKIPTPSKIDTMEIELKRVSARRKAAAVGSEKKAVRLHGFSESKPEKKGKGGIILLTILVIVLAAGAVYLYQRFYTSVDTYKTGVAKLNKEVSDLTKQVTVNKEVQKILLMKDAHIINLFGLQANKNAFGKIILSFESSSGYLQLSNLKELNTNEVYQLWMNANGATQSLGIFKPVDSNYYFPISLPAENYKGEIKFFITEEPSNGSAKPSNKIFLTGSLE